jgi:hypothetical protein
MKRQKVVRFVLILIVSVLWIYVFQIFGQEKSKEAGDFTIARLVVGTGVEKNEPVGTAATFPASTEKVYCFLEATQIPKDTEISVVWVYGGKEMLKTTLPIKAGAKWRTYANKNMRGLKGEWRVEIRGPEGKVLKDLKFKVE